MPRLRLDTLRDMPTVASAESRPGVDPTIASISTVVVAVAHNKGGVGKTTSTLIIARHLSQRLRVELVDMDETRVSPGGGLCVVAARRRQCQSPLVAARG